MKISPLIILSFIFFLSCGYNNDGEQQFEKSLLANVTTNHWYARNYRQSLLSKLISEHGEKGELVKPQLDKATEIFSLIEPFYVEMDAVINDTTENSKYSSDFVYNQYKITLDSLQSKCAKLSPELFAIYPWPEIKNESYYKKHTKIFSSMLATIINHIEIDMYHRFFNEMGTFCWYNPQVGRTYGQQELLRNRSVIFVEYPGLREDIGLHLVVDSLIKDDKINMSKKHTEVIEICTMIALDKLDKGSYKLIGRLKNAPEISKYPIKNDSYFDSPNFPFSHEFEVK